MATTLFGSQPYDPVRERRRRTRIIVAIIVVVVISALFWFFRYWPEEHRVDRFFAALQARNYEAAYGVWMSDPNWKQHPQQYGRYPYGSFYLDWGPGGEYGIVQDYRLDGAATPPVRGGSTGVVVVVTVNGRAEKVHIWVEKGTKTLSFSPY